MVRQPLMYQVLGGGFEHEIEVLVAGSRLLFFVAVLAVEHEAIDAKLPTRRAADLVLAHDERLTNAPS